MILFLREDIYYVPNINIRRALLWRSDFLWKNIANRATLIIFQMLSECHWCGKIDGQWFSWTMGSINQGCQGLHNISMNLLFWVNLRGCCGCNLLHLANSNAHSGLSWVRCKEQPDWLQILPWITSSTKKPQPMFILKYPFHCNAN